MRILQLIDSLRPGGAERMALNYFLTLQTNGIHSFIAATREEGMLATEVGKNPHYFFLKKAYSLDFPAFFRLKEIIYDNKITIIHAHGSSWFWAVLCKISGSKVKVVWHDHYGNSEFLDERKTKLLKLFSVYFDGIISVNEKLKNWAKTELNFKKPLIYLPNFIVSGEIKKVNFEGNTSINLVCVANLRPQKDHVTLIKAFKKVSKIHAISLHLFGKNFEDNYSRSIIDLVSKNDRIYYYGESDYVGSYLSRADIGILSSSSEGLPLALLEYGRAGLAVVSTNVGEIVSVTGYHAILVPPQNAEALAQGILKYIEKPEIRWMNSKKLENRINRLYSKSVIIPKYFEFINTL